MNDTYPPVPEDAFAPAQVVKTTATVLMMLTATGILTNALVIYAMAVNRARLSFDYVYIVSLVTADTLLCVVLFVSSALSVSWGEPAITTLPGMCIFQTFILEELAGASMFTLMAYAVVSSLSILGRIPQESPKLARGILICIWAVCIVQAGLVVVVEPSSVVAKQSGLYCHFTPKAGLSMSGYMQMVNMVVMIATPVTIAASYGAIWRHIWTIQVRIRQLTRKMEPSTESRSTTAGQPSKWTSQDMLDVAKTNTVYRGMIMSLVFFAAWSPMFMAFAVGLSGGRVSWELDTVALVLSVCNSVANPITALLLDRKLRTALWRLADRRPK